MRRASLRIEQGGRGVSGKPGRPRPRFDDPSSMAALCNGLAHEHRVRIACLLFGGPATHRRLAQTLRLQPGPLYHHARALQRAGILSTAGRNVYELTAQGRIALLLASAAGMATSKGRNWRLTPR